MVSLRGDNELLCSQHNGIYLGVLELVVKYDPFIKSHLTEYDNGRKEKLLQERAANKLLKYWKMKSCNILSTNFKETSRPHQIYLIQSR